jgi:exopolyphosphatase/guanosine-5'-triphosphate,3'-diphosphate pyrophosphatase
VAKKTAVIDIGSNSITLVIYKKTSRLAFYELYRQKYKIKIGEGSYKKDGFLQEEPMKRAYEALKDFSSVIRAYKCQKTLCIATSALRDAPNKREFIKRVEKELGIKIKVIDGQKEAEFGAISSLNLLPSFDEFVTVDIGGGSTEFAKVVNAKVVKTITLQLGHVRVYEKAKSMDEKKALIKSELKRLDSDFFSKRVVTIGGTAREIAKYIQKKEGYPLYKCLHAYSYSDETALKYMQKLIEYEQNKIKKYISKSRQETIQDGALILCNIVRLIEPKEIVVSSFGVREGVYLSDLLRSFNYKFPSNFKLDQRVLLDRFGEIVRVNNYYQNIANKLYPYIFEDDEFKKTVSYCSKLFLLNSMNFYSWIEYLNFVFTHKEKVTIAYLMQSFNDEELDKKLYKKYKSLLPDFKKLEKLFFILNLTAILAKNMKVQDVKVEKKDDLLTIKINISDLTKDEIENLKSPYKIKIESR